MYHNEHEIMNAVYSHFCTLADESGHIPINLRAPQLVGTVQDDPFDSLIVEQIESSFPDLEVYSSGSLTTPDLVIRDRKTGAIVGLEVKKLIQKPNGSDSRGLTMDYNSCLPCGTALIKVGEETVDIPCYYLFALLSTDSKRIVTLIVMHGDFINYDFNLHKEAKLANKSEYQHGPYGEGSVRRRAMYTYPNPLNYKLKCFHQRKLFVTKKIQSENMGIAPFSTEEIVRSDIYGNDFHYSVIDQFTQTKNSPPTLIKDIFAKCKERKPKVRNKSSMPKLSKL